jgi:dTMP kinase
MTSNNLGKLIVFEGADKVGKTTLSMAVERRLSCSGIKAKWLSFPGREPNTIGEWVYRFHHQTDITICPTALQMLHVAAHIDNISKQVIPALEQNAVVILDRFWWSTIVYGRESGVSDNDLKAMIGIELQFWKAIQPWKVFFVTREKPFENLPLDEWTAIVQGYSRLIAEESSNVAIETVVNDQSLDEMVNSLTVKITGSELRI